MTKRKSGFWTFLFSLIPGAGELYMGFRKQGLSIMMIFWLTIALASILHLSPVIFVLPILWFYSFFNVHNLKSLSDEEFYSIEDNFVLGLDGMLGDQEGWIKKYRNLIAVSLILMGGLILWNTLFSILYSVLPSFLMPFVNTVGNVIPKAVIALIIIYLGVYLIGGKKKELDDNEDA